MTDDRVGCEPLWRGMSVVDLRWSLIGMAARFRAVWLAGLLIAGLAGCDFAENKEAAEIYAEQVFEELSNGLTDAYLDLYSDEFYQHVTRERWRSIREQLRDALGAYRGHELTDWGFETSVQTGETVTLVYRVSYENMEAVETLSFRISDGVQLVGHHLTTSE